MVDIKNVDKKQKSLRLFSLPHKPLAINLMIDDENNIYGFDNCGSNYIGKLGENFKIILICFDFKACASYLRGVIDLDKKLILGNWISDEYMIDVMMEMDSYSSDSQLEFIPDDNLECFKNMTSDDLLAQFTAKITNDNCEQISPLLKEKSGRSLQLVR